MSPVGVRFDLVAAIEDNLGVKIEAVLVVPGVALATIPVGALEEPEPVEVRAVVLGWK